MAFWGVEVKPGKSFTLRDSDARKRLHISQATLGVYGLEYRSILACTVGDNSPIFLCSLSPNNVESCQLNLEFQESAEVEFTVIGSRSIHLSGYYLTTNRTFVVNDDKSETNGDGIEGSKSENNYNNDYNFINDGGARANCSDDSLEVPDSEDENVVQKSQSPNGPLSWRGETVFRKKMVSGVDTCGSCKVLSESKVKVSGATMLSSDHNGCEARLKKRKNEEQEDKIGIVSTAVEIDGLQVPHESSQNETQAVVKGNKSSLDNVTTFSNQNDPEKTEKKKRKTEFQEGSVKVSLGAEEIRAVDKEVKSSSNIPPFLGQEFCKMEQIKEEAQDRCIELTSGAEESRAQTSQYEVKLNEEKVINKIVENEGNLLTNLSQADGKTCKKRLEFREESEEKPDCAPTSVEGNMAIKLGQDKNGAVNHDTSLMLESSLDDDELIIEELEKGNSVGKRAKEGRTVSIFFTVISKETGQVLRSNVGGDLLRFCIGDGRDIDSVKRIDHRVQSGVIGMRAGDKRRITVALKPCPQSLCDGSKGHSKRVRLCDVEMVKVR